MLEDANGRESSPNTADVSKKKAEEEKWWEEAAKKDKNGKEFFVKGQEGSQIGKGILSHALTHPLAPVVPANEHPSRAIRSQDPCGL